MTNKIGIDAFEYYIALGPGRSYQAVADKYGVTKRAVTKKATLENWQQRIIDRERKAHEAMDKKAVETLEQMSARHLKVCKLIQRKALEALRSMPLTTAMEAVKALNLTIKQERLVRGEPTDRTASVEEVIKREYERWLTSDNPDDAKGEADDRDDAEATE
jgi:hypothetical protein